MSEFYSYGSEVSAQLTIVWGH